MFCQRKDITSVVGTFIQYCVHQLLVKVYTQSSHLSVIHGLLYVHTLFFQWIKWRTTVTHHCQR